MAKARKKGIEYFTDDESSSLQEIIENNPDDNVWKEYLEKNNLQNSDSAHRYITKKIGDYLSARDIGKNLSTRTLDKWRGQGKLEAVQLKGNWYYSRKSLSDAMKAATIKDLRK